MGQIDSRVDDRNHLSLSGLGSGQRLHGATGRSLFGGGQNREKVLPSGRARGVWPTPGNPAAAAAAWAGTRTVKVLTRYPVAPRPVRFPRRRHAVSLARARCFVCNRLHGFCFIRSPVRCGRRRQAYPASGKARRSRPRRMSPRPVRMDKISSWVKAAWDALPVWTDDSMIRANRAQEKQDGEKHGQAVSKPHIVTFFPKVKDFARIRAAGSRT